MPGLPHYDKLRRASQLRFSTDIEKAQENPKALTLQQYREIGRSPGLPLDHRQRLSKAYRSTDHDDVTAQSPCGIALHRGLSPVILGQGEGRYRAGCPVPRVRNLRRLRLLDTAALASNGTILGQSARDVA